MRWELIVDEIETNICIGICDAEQDIPQRVLVSARIWADYPARPTSIEECVDYGMLHTLVTEQWPIRAQTQLLETLAMELFAYIFSANQAIVQASVTLSKPDIFKDAKQVGITATLTRDAFEAL